MADIKETKELLTFAASLGEGVYETLEDGRLSIGDAKHFFPAAKDLIPAVRGILSVPGEIADLDEDELQELKDHFQTEFDIPNDRIEEFVEKAMSLGLKVLEFILFLRRWREEDAKAPR